MKVYSVYDDATEVLTTFDELKALRKMRQILEKHNVTWGWIDAREID